MGRGAGGATDHVVVRREVKGVVVGQQPAVGVVRVRLLAVSPVVVVPQHLRRGAASRPVLPPGTRATRLALRSACCAPGKAGVQAVRKRSCP